MASDEARLVIRAREPGRMSDLYSNPQAPDFYVDGVGGRAVGTAVSRLAFFRTIEIVESDTPGLEESIEKRQVCLNLIIPTMSLIEFAAGIMASVAANPGALLTPNKAVLETVERSLAAIREAMPKGQ